MSYEDWRPRRNQSRWTKTSIKKLRLRGIGPRKPAPAHWLTTLGPNDTQPLSLTIEELAKLRGQITAS